MSPVIFLGKVGKAEEFRRRQRIVIVDKPVYFLMEREYTLMDRRRLFIVMLLGAGLGLAASPAAGAVLTVTAGYGGYVVPNCWTPLEIQISGVVGEGWIEIARRQENSPPVVESYPCRVEKDTRRLVVPVFVEETGSRLQVRLVREGEIVNRVEVNLLEKVFPGHVILAVNVPAHHQHALSLILSPREPVLVIPAPVSGLPGSVLEYDGVSAVVMSGSPAVINPVQLQALQAWLAGGGRLAVFAGPGEAGEAGFLTGPAVDARGPKPGEVEQRRFGLGRVIILAEGPEDSGPSLTAADWRRLLALKPYPRPLRVTPGHVFSHGDFSPPVADSGGPSLLRVMIAAWFLGGLVISFFCPAHRFTAVFLLFCAVTILPAVPAGRRLAGIWQRGAVVSTQAVILPEESGILVNTEIRLPARTGRAPASPWGVTMALGDAEDGKINAGGTGETVWRHKHNWLKPYLAVRQGEPTRLRLTGWLPAGERTRARAGTAGLEQPAAGSLLDQAAAVVLWEETKWLEPVSGAGGWEWRETGGEPAWLRRDSWLAGLRALFPGEKWVAGYGVLPELPLTLQGGRNNLVRWAVPLAEGRQP